jgi:hypothetical protein
MDPNDVSREVLEAKHRSVMEFLQPFRLHLGGPSEELAALVRPRDDDYAKVWLAPYDEMARTGYRELWKKGVLPVPQDSSRTQLKVWAVPQLSLTIHDGPAYRHFPGGFRQVSAYMKADRWWAVFKYVRPGATSGMSYNGLVEMEDGRWIWFPKPWRVFKRPDTPLGDQ